MVRFDDRPRRPKAEPLTKVYSIARYCRFGRSTRSSASRRNWQLTIGGMRKEPTSERDGRRQRHQL